MFAQTTNLNDRSLDMEKQMAENVVQHTDLITNLKEFRNKQTAYIAAPAPTLRCW